MMVERGRRRRRECSQSTFLPPTWGQEVAPPPTPSAPSPSTTSSPSTSTSTTTTTQAQRRHGEGVSYVYRFVDDGPTLVKVPLDPHVDIRQGRVHRGGAHLRADRKKEKLSSSTSLMSSEKSGDKVMLKEQLELALEPPPPLPPRRSALKRPTKENFRHKSVQWLHDDDNSKSCVSSMSAPNSRETTLSASEWLGLMSSQASSRLVPLLVDLLHRRRAMTGDLADVRRTRRTAARTLRRLVGHQHLLSLLEQLRMLTDLQDDLLHSQADEVRQLACCKVKLLVHDDNQHIVQCEFLSERRDGDHSVYKCRSRMSNLVLLDSSPTSTNEWSDSSSVANFSYCLLDVQATLTRLVEMCSDIGLDLIVHVGGVLVLVDLLVSEWRLHMSKSSCSCLLLRHMCLLILSRLCYTNVVVKRFVVLTNDLNSVMVNHMRSESLELRLTASLLLRNVVDQSDHLVCQRLHSMIPELFSFAMEHDLCVGDNAHASIVENVMKVLGTVFDKSDEKLNVEENVIGFVVNMLAHKNENVAFNACLITNHLVDLLNGCEVPQNMRNVLRSHRCLEHLVSLLASVRSSVVNAALITLTNLVRNSSLDQQLLVSMGAPNWISALLHVDEGVVGENSRVLLDMLVKTKLERDTWSNQMELHEVWNETKSLDTTLKHPNSCNDSPEMDSKESRIDISKVNKEDTKPHRDLFDTSYCPRSERLSFDSKMDHVHVNSRALSPADSAVVSAGTTPSAATTPPAVMERKLSPHTEDTHNNNNNSRLHEEENDSKSDKESKLDKESKESMEEEEEDEYAETLIASFSRLGMPKKKSDEQTREKTSPRPRSCILECNASNSGSDYGTLADEDLDMRWIRAIIARGMPNKKIEEGHLAKHSSKASSRSRATKTSNDTKGSRAGSSRCSAMDASHDEDDDEAMMAVLGDLVKRGFPKSRSEPDNLRGRENTRSKDAIPSHVVRGVVIPKLDLSNEEDEDEVSNEQEVGKLEEVLDTSPKKSNDESDSTERKEKFESWSGERLAWTPCENEIMEDDEESKKECCESKESPLIATNESPLVMKHSWMDDVSMAGSTISSVQPPSLMENLMSLTSSGFDFKLGTRSITKTSMVTSNTASWISCQSSSCYSTIDTVQPPSALLNELDLYESVTSNGFMLESKTGPIDEMGPPSLLQEVSGASITLVASLKSDEDNTFVVQQNNVVGDSEDSTFKDVSDVFPEDTASIHETLPELPIDSSPRMSNKQQLLDRQLNIYRTYRVSKKKLENTDADDTSGYKSTDIDTHKTNEMATGKEEIKVNTSSEQPSEGKSVTTAATVSKTTSTASQRSVTATSSRTTTPSSATATSSSSTTTPRLRTSGNRARGSTSPRPRPTSTPTASTASRPCARPACSTRLPTGISCAPEYATPRPRSTRSTSTRPATTAKASHLPRTTSTTSTTTRPCWSPREKSESSNSSSSCVRRDNTFVKEKCRDDVTVAHDGVEADVHEVQRGRRGMTTSRSAHELKTTHTTNSPRTWTAKTPSRQHVTQKLANLLRGRTRSRPSTTTTTSSTSTTCSVTPSASLSSPCSAPIDSLGVSSKERAQRFTLKLSRFSMKRPESPKSPLDNLDASAEKKSVVRREWPVPPTSSSRSSWTTSRPTVPTRTSAPTRPAARLACTTESRSSESRSTYSKRVSNVATTTSPMMLETKRKSNRKSNHVLMTNV